MQPSIEKIQNLIASQKQTTAKQLREQLGISQVLVHRHLKTLCEKNIIRKIGSAPKVFYVPNEKKEASTSIIKSAIIEKNWLEIMPDGEFLYGEAGFSLWCKKRNFDPKEKAELFEKMFLEKEHLKKNNLLDATQKIQQSFQKNYLEKLWYVDFYSWEIFGKTLLGKLILYAKQNSDVVLMQKIAERIKEPILNLLNREKFDMIGIIPHSVPRKKDFLKTTLKFLSLKPEPKTTFQKIFAGHSVAQKTLKSKKEREENAEKTLILNIEKFPPKILLIDDACGSGSTLNIAAQKIHQINPKTKIYGLTFVGSLKGFDVIAES